MMCVYMLYGCGVQRAEEFLKQRVAIGTRVNTRVAQDEARGDLLDDRAERHLRRRRRARATVVTRAHPSER